MMTHWLVTPELTCWLTDSFMYNLPKTATYKQQYRSFLLSTSQHISYMCMFYPLTACSVEQRV